MNRVQFLSRLGLVFTCVSAMIVGTARAAFFTLTNNQDRTDGQALIGNNGGAVSIADTGGSGLLLYDFSGYTGLDLGAFRIKANAASLNLTLDMSDAGGSITNGGDISTSLPSQSTGSITITNAGSITIGALTTAKTGGGESANAGSIIVTQSGSFSASSANSSAPYYGNGQGSQKFVGNDTGSFTITTGGIRTGDQQWAKGGSLNIYDYTAVSVASGIVTRGGTVTIGQASNRIAGGVTVSGGVNLYTSTGSTDPVAIYAGGDVSIAGGVDSSNGVGGGYNPAGSVTVDTTNGAIGITGGITTTGYGIYHNTPGNIMLAASGDIAVSGTLNLAGGQWDAAGTLTLTATRGNSLITLGDLDLNKVKYAVVAPGWKCIVKGDLLGFSTNVTTQTQLRMPVGKRMIYYPGLTNNAYLMGGKYALASVDGTPAAGGVLMPYAAPGTVITVK